MSALVRRSIISAISSSFIVMSPLFGTDLIIPEMSEYSILKVCGRNTQIQCVSTHFWVKESTKMSWLANLKKVKEQRGVTYKWIATQSGIPEKTVDRLFSGCTDSPKVDTLRPICLALGVSLDDILADTMAVVGSKTLAMLQSEVDLLNAEVERLIAENAVLKDKLITAENNLKDTKLALQEQIIEVHKYYMDKNKKEG